MSGHAAGLLHALAAVGGPRSADVVALAAARGLLRGADAGDTAPPATTPPDTGRRRTPTSCPPGLCTPDGNPQAVVRTLADLIGNPARTSAGALEAMRTALDRHQHLAEPLLAVPGLGRPRAWPTARTLLLAAASSWSLGRDAQLELIARFADGPPGPSLDPAQLVPAPPAPAPWPATASRPATGDRHGTWLVALAVNPTLHPDAAGELFARYAGQPVTPLMAAALAELNVIYADGRAAGALVRTRLLELTCHLRTAAPDELTLAVAPLIEGASRRRALGMDLDPVEDGLLRAALANQQLDAGTLTALLHCYDSSAGVAAALGCRPLPADLLAAAALVTPAVLPGRQLDARQVGELLRAASAAPGARAEALIAALLEEDLLGAEHVPLLPWQVVASGCAHRTPTVAVTVPEALYRQVEATLSDLLAAAAADVLVALHGLGGSFTGTLRQFATIAPAVVV